MTFSLGTLFIVAGIMFLVGYVWGVIVGGLIASRELRQKGLIR